MEEKEKERVRGEGQPERADHLGVSVRAGPSAHRRTDLGLPRNKAGQGGEAKSWHQNGVGMWHREMASFLHIYNHPSWHLPLYSLALAILVSSLLMTSSASLTMRSHRTSQVGMSCPSVSSNPRYQSSQTALGPYAQLTWMSPTAIPALCPCQPLSLAPVCQAMQRTTRFHSPGHRSRRQPCHEHQTRGRGGPQTWHHKGASRGRPPRWRPCS